MMENVFNRLRECKCRSLPILRDGELAGLVTMENLGEFIMVQSAHQELGTGGEGLGARG